MPRVVLYSHDTFGLGHFRRCLKLAGCLAGMGREIEGILLTGSPWSAAFPLPPGFRTVPLAPVVKAGSRRYRARGADIPFPVVAAERRRVIERAVREFSPDLFIVDNVPCGLAGEVLPALRYLAKLPAARAVLSLRDVLDSPDVILSEWSDSGADEAVERLFDEIWVFGDRGDVAGLVETGPLSRAADKVHACGRIGLGPRPVRRLATNSGRERPTVLVTGGGGRDAGPLVTTFLEALRDHRPPVTSQVILGPDYPHDSAVEGQRDSRLSVQRFVLDMPRRIAASDVVVAMAGYNTVCEILESGRPAVLVPRVAPRAEQLLRALRWQAERRVKMIHPEDLDPASLWRAVEEVMAGPRPLPLRFDGGHVAAGRAAALLGA